MTSRLERIVKANPGVAPLLRCAAESRPNGLSDLATELGHLLAERSLSSDETHSVMLALALVHAGASPQLELIRRFLVAYESSRRHEEDLAQAAAALDSAALQLLNQLAVGPATQSELALGQDAGKVRRSLVQLEALGLIQTTSGASLKTLTALGHVLLRRLANNGDAA